jgi:serine/threonine protein kinase
MPMTEVKKWARGLLKGIFSLHYSDWIHGDLKPSNIMTDSRGRVRLIDLDLALPLKRIAHRRSTTHRDYRSPEAYDKILVKASEMWSVGCIIFEMLTGRNAFDISRRTAPQIAQAYKASVQEVRKRYPNEKLESLIDLLGKMMEMDYKKRITVSDALKHPFFK